MLAASKPFAGFVRFTGAFAAGPSRRGETLVFGLAAAAAVLLTISMRRAACWGFMSVGCSPICGWSSRCSARR
jgi:hypothetical protein